MPDPDDAATQDAQGGDLQPDDLQPGGKDPAEGARDGVPRLTPGDHPEEGHLGAAGDPAEG